jgi:hypothetical protein
MMTIDHVFKAEFVWLSGSADSKILFRAYTDTSRKPKSPDRADLI